MFGLSGPFGKKLRTPPHRRQFLPPAWPQGISRAGISSTRDNALVGRSGIEGAAMRGLRGEKKLYATIANPPLLPKVDGARTTCGATISRREKTGPGEWRGEGAAWKLFPVRTPGDRAKCRLIFTAYGDAARGWNGAAIPGLSGDRRLTKAVGTLLGGAVRLARKSPAPHATRFRLLTSLALQMARP